MSELTRVLKALANESRLRVLNLLLERECCVCEVMQVMEISQSRASRLLSALYDSGLLKLRREGRWAYYSINKNALKGYRGHILKGITRALEGNPIATEDREKLKTTERLGPGCATTGRTRG